MRTRAALGVLPIVVLPLVLTFGAPAPARAADTIMVVHGTYLTLTSIGDPNLMEHLAPDRPVQWQVGVQANSPQSSRIEIGISAQGALAGPGGLRVDIRACTVRWVDGTCSATESVWLPDQDLSAAVVPVNAYGAHLLGWMDSAEQRWLLVEATLPAGTAPGSTAQVRIHAWGSGDEIEIGGTTASALPATGSSIGPSLTLAVIAILSGIGLAGAAGRHSRRRVGRKI